MSLCIESVKEFCNLHHCCCNECNANEAKAKQMSEGLAILPLLLSEEPLYPSSIKIYTTPIKDFPQATQKLVLEYFKVVHESEPDMKGSIDHGTMNSIVSYLLNSRAPKCLAYASLMKTMELKRFSESENFDQLKSMYDEAISSMHYCPNVGAIQTMDTMEDIKYNIKFDHPY